MQLRSDAVPCACESQGGATEHGCYHDTCALDALSKERSLRANQATSPAKLHASRESLARASRPDSTAIATIVPECENGLLRYRQESGKRRCVYRALLATREHPHLRLDITTGPRAHASRANEKIMSRPRNRVHIAICVDGRSIAADRRAEGTKCEAPLGTRSEYLRTEATARHK